VIDLDDKIRDAKAAAKAAAKSLAQARSQARVERKRRAQLVRKAGQLSAQDLERIAVLKRTGWWDPSSGEAIVPAESDEQQVEHRKKRRTTMEASTRGSASASSAATGATGTANPAGGVGSRAPSPAPRKAGGRTTAEVEGEDDDAMQDEERQVAAAEAAESELEPEV